MVARTNTALPWRTLSANVAIGLPRGLTKSEDAARVEELLDLVGLRSLRYQ